MARRKPTTAQPSACARPNRSVFMAQVCLLLDLNVESRSRLLSPAQGAEPTDSKPLKRTGWSSRGIAQFRGSADCQSAKQQTGRSALRVRVDIRSHNGVDSLWPVIDPRHG